MGAGGIQIGSGVARAERIEGSRNSGQSRFQESPSTSGRVTIFWNESDPRQVHGPGAQKYPGRATARPSRPGGGWLFPSPYVGRVGYMGSDDDKKAAVALVGRAHEVGHAPDGTPWRRFLRAFTCGRLGQRSPWAVITLDTPWQDTPSTVRLGWRERAANLSGESAFAVDYIVCDRCRRG